ncbi:MAG TPA: F0F1 ATP synthase subunit delta [Mycobacteriales bacterium]|nr:F0F1 ATP synthase subunit delta [Mycobacteriales bacterium]
MTMHAASRETLASAVDRLDRYADQAGPEELERLSDELFAVLRLLVSEPVLRRHLAEGATGDADRPGLLGGLLAGKVHESTLETLRPLERGRWSHPGDLVEAVEILARQAALAQAQRNGSIEEVEDELFRFSRILEGQPRLRSLLADPTAPAERREELLDAVVAGKVRPVTARLLRQVVALPRGRSLERAVERLSELAAARRDRYIAHVQAAAPLSAGQERRLADVLARVYGRQIALQTEIDPDLLGGLLIRVGDEIIDGSIAGRLAKARQRLAG